MPLITTKPMTRYHLRFSSFSSSCLPWKQLLCLSLQMCNSIHACVFRVPQLQVGVEFEASTRMQETSVSFGYQLDVPKANLLFKGKAG